MPDDLTPQDQPTEPVRSTMAESAMAITQRGLDEQAADAVPDAGTDGWWEALGDEGAKLREGKKWESPTDLLKAYKEASGRLSRRDEERQALEDQIAELRAQQSQVQAPPSAGQQQGPPALDFDALAAQCIDPTTGEMNYGHMMSVAVALGARMAFDASEQRMNERLSQFETERVSPLAERDAQVKLAEELDRIEGLYGAETFGQLESRIEAEMEDDPGFLDRFGGPRGAFAEMAFRMQAEQAQEREAFTTRGGGRRPQAQQMTPEQAELAAMEIHLRRRNDGFRMHSRLRWG